ncbi:glutamate racemase [Apibacter sp. HY039]|uniref:glutamate racemase n=1 Tax=Apibacter sp. HY039 TaxID=2501476 RepID=UPI000FEC1A98|nr:glutamate racemase [Apibacter sp. HY039]
MRENQPIGIFDSGMGGLTTAKEIKRLLPNESVIYFGDSKHLPYGDKSKDVIIEYSEQITRFLIEKGCKAIVIACNTATSNALHEVKAIAESHKVPVYDVISPVAEKVAYAFNQNIGVIATKSTIASHIYRKSIRKLNKHIEVQELATPLLAPVIEEGFNNHAISEIVLRTYLNNKKLQNIDSLILGCTHYPLILNEVKQFYQNKIQVIDSPLIVANFIKHDLEKRKLLSNTSNSVYEFYVSDLNPNFARLAKKFFGSNINLETINLNNPIPALSNE